MNEGDVVNVKRVVKVFLAEEYLVKFNDLFLPITKLFYKFSKLMHDYLYYQGCIIDRCSTSLNPRITNVPCYNYHDGISPVTPKR